MKEFLFKHPRCLIFNTLIAVAFLVLLISFTVERNWVLFFAFATVGISFLLDLIAGIRSGSFSGLMRPIYDGKEIFKTKETVGFWLSAICRLIIACAWFGIGCIKCLFGNLVGFSLVF